MSRLSERLIAFNAGRLADMLALKYTAMKENAFRFFRGTCHLFYEELASARKFPSSPTTWICGDLHLENFGSYKANNKLVYFDLNDFDEAILAPCLWEVARLVTSIFLAFTVLDIDEEKARNMAQLFVATYSATLCKGKAISIEPRTSKGIVQEFLRTAKDSSYQTILKKRTEEKKRKVWISRQDERHFKIKKPLKKELMAHVQQWIDEDNNSPYNYKVTDAVFRLAGTGSIGVKRYLFLLESTNDVGSTYLLVDMKQSFSSSLALYVDVQQPLWNSDAERIIQVQQRMQNMSSSLLSSTTFHDETYVMQELQPVKDTIRFKAIKDRYRDMCQVIDDMATLTASSQLRSGGMDGSAIIDDLKAFGCRKDWQDAVIDHAVKESKTVSTDYLQFLKDHDRHVFERR